MLTVGPSSSIRCLVCRLWERAVPCVRVRIINADYGLALKGDVPELPPLAISGNWLWSSHTLVSVWMWDCFDPRSRLIDSRR